MKLTICNIFAGMLLFGGVSCTANYEEINSNPYQAGDLTPDDYILGSAMNAMSGCVVSPDVNTTQFTDCLLGGTQGGYLADAKDAWSATISNYNPTDDWSRVFLKTDKLIPVLYANLNTIRIISEMTGNPVPYAIATIIKVAAMHRVADTYGPIPYSQIGNNGEIKTPYDPLDEVYDQFFEELDEAIGVLTQNENYKLTASADYVYEGNVQKWIKFANSLKLRLAIRIAYASPIKAKEMAESAVSHPIGVITANADNAAWNYFGASVNPLYTAVNYNKVNIHGDGTSCATSGDSHAAADIICYMSGYKDNRCDAYFTKSEWGDDYVGLRRGISIPEHSTVGHKYSGPNIAASAPLYWLNAAEVAFLRAEGKAVFGFDMGGEAKNFYEQGVRLSFEQWGAKDVETYLSDGTSTPKVYDDPSGSNSYHSQLSTCTIKWQDDASIEQMQERIIIQKWIANWLLGNEAWADYRRTGYPHLIPASLEGNKSNGEVNSEEGARRMRYPLDEYVSNTQNVTEAVESYLNGPDKMSTKLWWDCKGK